MTVHAPHHVIRVKVTHTIYANVVGYGEYRCTPQNAIYELRRGLLNQT